MSALTTRIFMVGLGETKSLNAAIKYFKGLDKSIVVSASPLSFWKVLKHNGKFFGIHSFRYFWQSLERISSTSLKNLKKSKTL